MANVAEGDTNQYEWVDIKMCACIFMRTHTTLQWHSTWSAVKFWTAVYCRGLSHGIGWDTGIFDDILMFG
jgi:hypothetical protein